MSLFRLGACVGAALGLWFASAPVHAAVTHTTANLNLRAGPSMDHQVRAVIPGGAPIDIHSCGHTWCYVGWAGHIGYVDRRYLIHHVVEKVPPLVHVTHVHLHTAQ